MEHRSELDRLRISFLKDLLETFETAVQLKPNYIKCYRGPLSNNNISLEALTLIRGLLRCFYVDNKEVIRGKPEQAATYLVSYYMYDLDLIPGPGFGTKEQEDSLRRWLKDSPKVSFLLDAHGMIHIDRGDLEYHQKLGDPYKHAKSLT